MTNPPVVTSHPERDASKQSRCSRYPWLKFMLFFESLMVKLKFQSN